MAAVYKEITLQNKLTITNIDGNESEIIYLKMPVQTLQALPHTFDNQVIEEIYIDVDSTLSAGDLTLILPPISNPNITTLPDLSLPNYTSADTGFKGSWGIKIYINYQPTGEASGSVNIVPFEYVPNAYADNINGNSVVALTDYLPNSTIYLKPVEDFTWMGLISYQPLVP